MAASAGFTFGFVVDDDDIETTAVTVADGLDRPGQQQSEKLTAPSQSNPSSQHDHDRDQHSRRRPFAFFEPALLKRLLLERAQEEIIHDELRAGDCDDSVLVRRVDTDRTSFVESTNDISETALAATTTTATSPSKLKLRNHHPGDLLPGVYEGGAAVWEASLDLLEYLASIRNELVVTTSQTTAAGGGEDGPSILELGCGQALPALYLLQVLEPRVVVLTDYNDDVLKDVTISNLVINHATDLDGLADRVVLGAGDWMEFSKALLEKPNDSATTTNATSSSNSKFPADGRFDIILAAETLYTPQAAQETAYLVAHHLATLGIAYIGTKRYYFGVGGGSDAFGECAVAHGLSVETVYVVDNGRGNVREVLKVTRQEFRNWF